MNNNYFSFSKTKETTTRAATVSLSQVANFKGQQKVFYLLATDYNENHPEKTKCRFVTVTGFVVRRFRCVVGAALQEEASLTRTSHALAIECANEFVRTKTEGSGDYSLIESNEYDHDSRVQYCSTGGLPPGFWCDGSGCIRTTFTENDPVEYATIDGKKHTSKTSFKFGKTGIQLHNAQCQLLRPLKEHTEPFASMYDTLSEDLKEGNMIEVEDLEDL